MLDRQTANAAVIAVIETLAEVPDGEGPEGVMFAALMKLGLTSDDWRAVRNILVAGKLVEPMGNHVIRITDKGRETVKKVAEYKAAQKAKAGASS